MIKKLVLILALVATAAPIVMASSAEAYCRACRRTVCCFR